MMEEQAAARVHRPGQTREVTINRYIVKNSVEEVSFFTKLAFLSLSIIFHQVIRAKQTEKRGIAELSDQRDKKPSPGMLLEDL